MLKMNVSTEEDKEIEAHRKREVREMNCEFEEERKREECEKRDGEMIK